MNAVESPSHASRVKPTRVWRSRTWWILAGFLVVLLAAEVGLRILGGRNSQFVFRMGAEKEWDPHRGVRLRRNYINGDIRTNSKGILGPEFDAAKAPDSFRIVTLGDSASVIPPRYNYPRALEDELRKIRLGVDVINASCAGYDSGQARTWYEREIDGYEHDMLLIYLGWNDMGQYNPDGLIYKMVDKGYTKELSLIDRAILNVYLLRSLHVVRGYWEQRGAVSIEPLSREEARRYREFHPIHFEQNLLAIVRLAQSRGRVVRLLNWGGLVVGSPTGDELARMHFPRGLGKRLPKYQALLAAYKHALEKVARETSTPIIDVESFFKDPARRSVFTDSNHFREEGAVMFASIVADAIRTDIP